MRHPTTVRITRFSRLRGVRYHRGTEAAVFPSRLESFVHPLLEALAMGMPLLASDIPAAREIAERVASFFDPRDPTA